MGKWWSLWFREPGGCIARGEGREELNSQAPGPRPCQHLLLQWIPYNLRVQERIQTKIFPVCNQGYIKKKRGGGLNKQLGFPSGSAREGNGNPLQYSCLENPMDGGAQWAAVQGVAESRTRPSDFLLSLSTFMHWRRKWQPTPVILPGESQGRGSLVGCHLWGRTESDTTEAT